MRTLRVLGGLWLDEGDGPSSGRGAQRRRLALLTLLGLSPGRRVTRDKAIATLWPENTTAEGRRRLSSAVYDLRRLLGDDAIESVGDELWLAPTVALRIDVDDFEAALAGGDAEAAVAAYGGPLLDGVHLSGAAEFEEWIATRRERARRQYLRALEQVTSTRLSRGDRRGAVSAALQLVDLEPLSASAALVAVKALVAAGDRPRALAAANAYTSRVRRELGAEPDDAVIEAARRLRAPARRRSSSPEDSTDHSTATLGPVEIPISTSNAASAAILVAGSQPRPSSPVLLPRTAAAAAIVLGLAGVAFRSRTNAPRHEPAGRVELSGFMAAATHSTTSAAARKSFVDGESAYASGRYDAAAKFFRAAIAEDSTFALAHFRLSASMLWQEEPSGYAATHDSLALRWSSGLSDRDQRLVRAYVAWRRGKYEVADTLDRTVMRADPTNVEAQFQFGELLFHYNPLRGRSVGEAGAWFERVVSLDSANWGARWHLLLLDASRLSAAEFRGRVKQLLDAQPDGHLAAELRLFSARRDELPAVATGTTDAVMFDAAWRRAVFRRDLSGAMSLLNRMADQGRSEHERASGSFGLAALRFGQGRSAAALPLLEIGGATRTTSGDAWIIAVHGLIANHVSTVLDTLSRAIEQWRQAPVGFDQPTSGPAIIARYLEGLLAASRGDTAGVLRAAIDLDALGHVHDPYLPAEFRHPHELAQTVRAYRDLRLGNCEAALRELDAEKGTYWLGVVASSPLASQSFERYVRAECLLSLRRYPEAVQWFETLEQGTIFDLEFLDASLSGQAAAHRAMGDTEAAAKIERRRAEIGGQ